MAFRELESRRIEASNTIWALLVGADLAANAISQSRETSELTLAKIFPSVKHVQRFDLRADRAQTVLGKVEKDFCTMAMAHSIALHEDFVKCCLEMLIPQGKYSRTKLREVNTNTIHEDFATATGQVIDADILALFHLTRLIRNCHIHAGGRVNARLKEFRNILSESQAELWEELSGEPPESPDVGDNAKVGVGGLVATLAIGKQLAYEINLGLQRVFPRAVWADIAVDEYLRLSGKRPSDTTVIRSLPGYLRGGFGALRLSGHELQAALDRLR